MSPATHISPEKLRIAWLRPQPIWLGKPRPRRPSPSRVLPPSFANRLRSALRSLKRDPAIIARRKLAAVDKRKRRQARNRGEVWYPADAS